MVKVLKMGLRDPPNYMFSKVNSFEKKYHTFFRLFLCSDMVRKLIRISQKWFKKSLFVSKVGHFAVFSRDTRAFNMPRMYVLEILRR